MDLISSKRSRRRVRLLGAVSGAALAVGLLPVTAASAEVTAAGVEDICPAPGQEDAFTDDSLNTFEDRINCAAAYDLVRGKTTTTFDPQGFLTRGQAATILVQYVEVSDCDVALDTDGTDDFTDVDGNTHEANIQKAADNGIVNGYGDDTFRPDLLISRAQFATMAVQATEVALGEDLGADADSDFDDIAGSVHAPNIEKAYDNGMLVGTSPRTFSPNQNVTRGQATSIVIGAAGQILFPAGEFCPAEPDPGFEILSVSPATDQTVECVDGLDDGDDSDDVEITVTGLSGTEDYRLTLVAADNIDVDDDGFTTFVEDADTGLAAAGMLDARIVTVNGAAPTVGQSVGAVTPVSGTITFVIECNGAEALVPVVYTDQGGANTRLNIDDVGRPTEPFGIGGTVTFTPPPVQGAVTVAADDPVVQGGDVVLTVVGGDVASVAVTGACADPQSFLAADDEDDVTAGLQLSVAVDADAAVGDCVLTVVTTFTEASGLTPDTDPVTVEVTSSDVVPPAVVNVTHVDAAVVFSFNEDIECASVAASDITLAVGGVDPETFTVSCDAVNNNVAVTLSDPLEAGESVTLAALSVDDLAGNAGPTTAVVSVDTDGDGDGNGVDTDDDGDGISDVDEIAAGTDPLNPDVTAPTFAIAASGGNTTFTFTANEGLECDSFVSADVAVDADTEVGVATCDEITDAITIVFDDALDVGEGVTLSAGSVRDLAGNPGPTVAAGIAVA